MTIPYRLKGLDQAESNIEKLKTALQRKIVRKAFRQGLRPMLRQVKSNAPTNTGAVKKSFKIRSIKRTRTSIGMLIVSSVKDPVFQGDEAEKKKRGNYGGSQEVGVKHRKRKDGTKRPGWRIEPTHFAQDAYKSEGQTTIRIIGEQTKRMVREEVLKMKT